MPPDPIELPEQLHLLTLMVDTDNEARNVLIMRIEHIFDAADDPTQVSIDLGNFLESYGFSVISMVEIGLGTNMDVSELDSKLKWNAESESDHRFNSTRNVRFNGDFWYSFSPMQIRTFRIWYIPFT
jgi:hypothetical protein